MFYSGNDGGANQQLRPIGGPWSFFARMRVIAGGQVLEDVDMYNKVHEMISIFTATESRDNDYGEGFSMFWDNVVDVDTVGARHLRGIPSGHSMTVLSNH